MHAWFTSLIAVWRISACSEGWILGLLPKDEWLSLVLFEAAPVIERILTEVSILESRQASMCFWFFEMQRCCGLSFVWRGSNYLWVFESSLDRIVGIRVPQELVEVRNRKELTYNGARKVFAEVQEASLHHIAAELLRGEFDVFPLKLRCQNSICKGLLQIKDRLDYIVSEIQGAR